MAKPTTQIRDWAFAEYNGNKVLVGVLLENHDNFNAFDSFGAKGHRIITSPIDKIWKYTPVIVETINTIYSLTGPSKPEIIDEIIKEKGLELKALDEEWIKGI